MYKTADINLAATLLALGHRLQSFEASDGRRKEFVFDDNKKLDTDIEKYWDDLLSLNPRLVLDSLKSLKSRMYNQPDRYDY